MHLGVVSSVCVPTLVCMCVCVIIMCDDLTTQHGVKSIQRPYIHAPLHAINPGFSSYVNHVTLVLTTENQIALCFYRLW